MEKYGYQPSGVCAKQITFGIEEGKLHDVAFIGGCNGNLRAIGTLLEGMDARQAATMLRGNDCNGRGTSCADQLAQAVNLALDQQQ